MAKTGLRAGPSAARGEWAGGRFPAPMFITGEGPIYRPDLIVWLDVDKDVIFTADVVRPEQPNSLILEALDKALAQNDGERPAVVRVRDEATAEIVRVHLGRGTEVRVDELPEIDRVIRTLAEHRPSEPSHLTTGVAPEVVARFFRATAALYRAAPWHSATDDQLLAIDAPELGLERACACIVGALGESFGVLLFRSVADYRRFGQLEEERASSGPPRRLGMTLFAVNFEQGSTLAPSLRREIARAGWEVADAHGYPRLQLVESDFVERPASERDWLLGIALAEALAAFFGKHRELFAEEAPVPVHESYRFDDLSGGPRLQVTAPHPEQPWDHEAAAAELELERFLEEQSKLARELWEAFLADQRSAGRDRAWLELATVVLDLFYSFKVREHDGFADGLTAVLVERFLLERVPATLENDPRLIAVVPEVLERLTDWLHKRGELAAKKAEAVHRRLEKLRTRYPKVAADPRRWSFGKRMIAEARTRGIRPGDVDGMRRFVAEHHPELRLETPPHERRWAGPAPGPHAPCPCGSGRKYKKCCMPR